MNDHLMYNMKQTPRPITDVNRRDFIKLSGIFASGLMLAQAGWANPMATNKSSLAQNGGFQYLTPVFIMDQAARLGQGSSFLQAGLKYCITSDIHTILPGNAFRMGAVMPFGKEELLSSFTKLKEVWNTGQQDQATAQRLAVLTGAITYRSIMKAIDPANTVEQTASSGNPEQHIYQDATLISSYLSKGEKSGDEEKEQLHNLFRQMLTRTFIRFHTLMPDEADGAAWLDKIVAWRKQNDQYYGQLAAAIAQPDASKMKQYISDTRFFDSNDTILKQVSPFERVSGIGREEGEKLLASAQKGSACAQALANGYQTLIALSDFLSGSLKESEMEERLGKI